ncbi:metal ABC transporter permease [Opitutia bacterium ISCC 51]|nr:metal ABC transporter permease [Opitutae bacterium ISCC 51]QXD27464.1 metal ABC transporter permease [Opitutae bacterium ISCC 52]
MGSLGDIFFDDSLSFMSQALLLGLLASIPFGTMGSLVVARRISYLAAAIAHAVLGGIGFSLFAKHQWEWTWIQPLTGALMVGILAALLVGWISIKHRAYEDTLIGAIWSLGMAIGLLFIFKTPQYVDPMSYLFGDILMISSVDITLVLVLCAIVVGFVIYSYQPLVALCFDEEFAKLRGIQTTSLYLLTLCLVAITIVFLVSMVGVILVIALLSLPAAMAGLFSRKLWQMMVGGTVICMLFTFLGTWLSYSWDLPTGPFIILLCGISYLLMLILKKAR